MLAILIAILIPCLFLFLVWSLEMYAISRMPLLIGATLWGIASFGIAFVVQTFLLENQIITLDEILTISAPILEEGLKAVFLVWLVRKMMLAYAVDGAVYGFATGTGFAVAENLLYLAQNPDQSVDVALARVLSASLMHAFNTALVGTVAGLNIYQGRRARYFRLYLVLSTVITLHSIYNEVASQLSGLPLLVLSSGMGLGGTAFIIFLIQKALQAESRSIANSLTDTISAGERAAVLKPQELAKILENNQDKFDSDRARIIQEYIDLKGQEGVLRKTMMLNQRHKHHATLERHLKNIQQQLEATRGSMGLYTWIWLRSVLPSEESTVWSHLHAELQTDHPALNLMVKLNARREQIYPGELGSRITALKQNKLFQELDNDDLEDVALSLEEQHYSLGDIIIEQGEIVDKLYCIVSGRVAVAIAKTEGEGMLLWEHERGEIFGQFSMLDMQPHPATICCLQKVTLYTLPREDFIALIYAKPQISVYMMQLLVSEARKGSARLIAAQQSILSQDN